MKTYVRAHNNKLTRENGCTEEPFLHSMLIREMGRKSTLAQFRPHTSFPVTRFEISVLRLRNVASPLKVHFAMKMNYTFL